MKKTVVINLQQVSKSFTLNRAEKLKNYIKYFNIDTEVKKSVLNNVDLTVYKNETIGLFGPNGSGKSTLMRIVAGILEPDSGHIEVNGTIAPVLELGAGLHIDLTGLENIKLYGALLGLPSLNSTQKIKQIISFSELGDYIHCPVRKYSSGMKSRLAFSIAIFSDADTFLLDEVFAVGDKKFIDKSYKALKKLKKEKTIIITSHNMGLLFSFSDRIIRFENGRIKKGNKLINFFLDLPKNTEFMSEVVSNSMFPFLKKGDGVVVTRVPYSKIKIGDVVAIYIDKLDEAIIHRVAGKKDNREYITRGDNSYFYDNWALNKENYIGVVKKE